MVLNSISVPTKRKIVGATLGVLSLAQLPMIGPPIVGFLGKTIVDPISVGVVVGAVGLVGAYMMLAREGI